MEPRPPGHKGPEVEAVDASAAPGAAPDSAGGLPGAPDDSSMPRPVLLLNTSPIASDLSPKGGYGYFRKTL